MKPLTDTMLARIYHEVSGRGVAMTDEDRRVLETMAYRLCEELQLCMSCGCQGDILEVAGMLLCDDCIRPWPVAGDIADEHADGAG